MLFPSRLLLPRIRRPRLGRLFPITPNHDHAQETAHDGRSEEDEDDRYADGPDARGEEVVEGVALVDEGLGKGLLVDVYGERIFGEKRGKRRKEGGGMK